VGGRLPASRRGSRCHHDDDEDDDDNDSDSDEGLTMARPKKKSAEPSVSATAAAALPPSSDTQAQTHGVERLIGHARRRDTNASVGSTETARKMFPESD